MGKENKKQNEISGGLFTVGLMAGYEGRNGTYSQLNPQKNYNRVQLRLDRNHLLQLHHTELCPQ